MLTYALAKILKNGKRKTENGKLFFGAVKWQALVTLAEWQSATH